jgi:lysophospholipase L1-like esterase
MKIIRVIFFNILIFFFSILSIELLFGYWFDKNNLGPYMREHRMKKNHYSLQYENKFYEFIYKRNYHGFRGDEIELEQIKAVMLGGSTTDERYKPEDFTIVGNLNKKLFQDNIALKITNAGIEGQSTQGHIYNFKEWFPRLKKFKPDFFIFYIGINDQLMNYNKPSDDGHVVNPSKLESIKDNLKSRSIFYDLIRKTKDKYHMLEWNDPKKARVTYDFNYSANNYLKGNKYKFLNYEKAIKLYKLDLLQKKYKENIKIYLNNIDKLVKYSHKFNAKPIFINQLTHNGNYNEKIFIFNYSLINHCKQKGYSCIDLAKKLNGKLEYWWDGIHTTPKGSKVITNIIYPDLKNFLINN